MTQIVMPMHTNGVAGVMFGGVMMQWIDVCAGVAAMRHASGAVLTASIDRLDFLSPSEKQFLPFSGKLITFEIGIRFLADFLAGDTYFKVHREGHNLDRCRTQFKLVESIEQQEAKMNKLVEQS